MPLYEIVLRYDDREEVRLTDVPPVGKSVEIGGRVWLVGEAEIEKRFRVAARYACVELREHSRLLRKRSSDLRDRGHELRVRRPEDGTS